ncbi:YueI family protein [Streptococcus sanguinis]|uniref:DUF1694 domain-containing protein n=1 Tax=Streptococcus sanguinis TaxID=1305 RepID=UPI0022852A31|nr:DUF1694 domain-containing protein [Streptococcus sanguinis]MCY7016762.1 YueI family protein [Streptococcus sanguinis]
MSDINKVIMEKAQGGVKLNPDEQRRFLGTFEERVLAYCSIEQANGSLIHSHFKEMLSNIIANSQPVLVKISPEVESGNQIFYLKTSKELGCEATIVSSDYQSSPFGLIVHSDHLVQVDAKDMSQQFASLLQPAEKPVKEKRSLWKKWFG